MNRNVVITAALLLSAVVSAGAQTPRISALFPAGAKAGESVDVSVRGGGLVGARRVVVIGAGGVTAELAGGNVVVDEGTRPLFQQKCGLCHEARSPANRTLTPEQWAATVDRMINVRSAPIAKDERDKIVTYLQASARAGQVVARVQVAPDAAPGMREVRIVTDRGTSTAWPFEVGALPETAAAEPNSKPDQPQKVALPVVVNGALATGGERDYFAFEAKKGQRLTFNLKGFRLNEQSQAFFNPTLTLYDAGGKELARSHGYFDYDPLIDWTAPSDGTYTLLVRDLLWRGSPASVYRLAMGPLPYAPALFPAAGRPGQTLQATLTGAFDAGRPVEVRVPPGTDGVITVPTPAGEAPFLVRDLPDGGGPLGRDGNAVPLPALFRGRIVQPGQTDTYRVQVKKGGTGLDVFARRLGSPLRARITVMNDKGKVLRSLAAEGGGDVSLPDAFPRPGEYLVEVADAGNNAGPDFAYYLEAPDGALDFALQATPDNLNLAPGATAALLVRATRRQGVRGPITLSVRNLPPGVTASPAVIPPDDDKAVVTLSAAPGTAPDLSVTVVEGQASEGAQTVVRRAQPIELYRINNNDRPRPLPRSSLVVAVSAAPPDFTLALGTDTLALAPGEEARVPVKVVRSADFKGAVALTVPALPPGVTMRAETVTVPAGESEATLTLRASAEARFLRERPLADLPPLRIVVTGTAGDVTYSSAPVAIIGTSAGKKQVKLP